MKEGCLACILPTVLIWPIVMAKRTSAEFFYYTNVLFLSFPISLAAIPKEARYLSWELIDYDTIPLIGFPFYSLVSRQCSCNQ